VAHILVQRTEGNVSRTIASTAKELFDDLLEQPEHRARIKEESGLSRGLYLEKVIKTPTKELADMYYDLAKKRYEDKEKEKVPKNLSSKFQRQPPGPMRFDRSRKGNKVSRRRHALH
jgi:hypothetical protein